MLRLRQISCYQLKKSHFNQSYLVFFNSFYETNQTPITRIKIMFYRVDVKNSSFASNWRNSKTLLWFFANFTGKTIKYLPQSKCYESVQFPTFLKFCKIFRIHWRHVPVPSLIRHRRQRCLKIITQICTHRFGRKSRGWSFRARNFRVEKNLKTRENQKSAVTMAAGCVNGDRPKAVVK